MKDELITYKTAQSAKEVGFNEWCQDSWSGDKIMPTNDFTKKHLFAPTQSLLQRWLRERHNIHVLARRTDNTDHTYYQVWVYDANIYESRGYGQALKVSDRGHSETCEHSYEKVLEIGLQRGLKILANKQE